MNNEQCKKVAKFTQKSIMVRVDNSHIDIHKEILRLSGDNLSACVWMLLELGLHAHQAGYTIETTRRVVHRGDTNNMMEENEK